MGEEKKKKKSFFIFFLFSRNLCRFLVCGNNGKNVSMGFFSDQLVYQKLLIVGKFGQGMRSCKCTIHDL